MSKYVVLVNWTDQGVKNANQTIDRGKAFTEMVTQNRMPMVADAISPNRFLTRRTAARTSASHPA